MQRDWYQVLSRVNLHQLLSFLVVAEEKTFRGPAYAHFAVGGQWAGAATGESVGCAAVHRTTRSVTLTREGSVLAAVAQRVSDR